MVYGETLCYRIVVREIFLEATKRFDEPIYPMEENMAAAKKKAAKKAAKKVVKKAAKKPAKKAAKKK